MHMSSRDEQFSFYGSDTKLSRLHVDDATALLDAIQDRDWKEVVRLAKKRRTLTALDHMCLLSHELVCSAEVEERQDREHRRSAVQDAMKDDHIGKRRPDADS